MGKRSKEIAETAETSTEVVKTPKKKKKAAPVVQEAVEEVPNKGKKKKKVAVEAEVEEQEELPGPASKKAKKQKKVEAADNTALEEETSVKKKNQKNKQAAAVEEAEVVEEAQPTAPKKKKKKEVIQEEEGEDDAPAQQEKVERKVQEEHVSAPKTEASSQQSWGKEKAKGRETGRERDTENTVLVRGLPFSTTEDTLYQDFQECGEIVSCRMLYNDAGQCKGVAFIKYTSPDGCNKAVNFDGTVFGSRTIYVSHAGGDKGKSDKGKGKSDKGKAGKGKDIETTVFIRGLPFATTEQLLKKDFKECGEVLNVSMPLESDGRCKGIAFVKFPSKECCAKAIEFDNTEYGGRTIFVTMAIDDGGKGKDGKGKGKDSKTKDGKGGKDNENTVCIRGLSRSVTDESLKSDFGECGEIVSSKIVRDLEGNMKGFAFVKYASKEACDKALEFDSTDYAGKYIYVAMAGAARAENPNAKGKGKGKGKGKDDDDDAGKGYVAPTEAEAKATGALIYTAGNVTKFADSDED